MFLTVVVSGFLTDVISCQALESVISNYKSYHSRSSLLENSVDLCSQKYVYSSFNCTGAGNFVSAFLNEFALAVVLNRTIFVDYQAEDCFGVVDIADWIIRYDDLKKAVNGKCPLINQPLNYGYPYRCCDLETINTTVVSVNQHYNLVYEEFRPNSGAVLSQAARVRADLLFGHPNGLGRFVPFGLLHSHAIVFTDLLKKTFTNNILADVNTTKTIIIGLHVRHWGYNADETEVDAVAEKCVTQLKMRHVPENKNCLILLASDRTHSFDRFKTFAASINCQIKHVDRDMGLQHVTDHGPWGDSETAMADWALLTQSDFFVGLHASTFSMIMANVVAYNSWLRGETENPLLFMRHGGLRHELQCGEYQYEEPLNPCSSRKYHYNPMSLMCMPMNDEL